MELPITQEHLDIYETVGDILIQDAFPNLDKEQREFLLSGITPQEWNDTFGEEGDDE
tara:strand:+ start:937 stop:1107 length:171 start_codon:yes stop_codon:yes gene_type:complete